VSSVDSPFNVDESPDERRPEPDGESQELGHKIRALRTEKGLTLDTVAGQAGVSRSLISQVERGLAQPSLTTLRSIASVLGVQMATLFHDDHSETALPVEEAPEQRFVVRGGHQKHVRLDAPGAEYRLLTPDGDRLIEFLWCRVAPSSSMPPGDGGYQAHRGEEDAYVLSGSLTYLLGGIDEVVVHAGDSISFDASIPHRVENRTTEPADLIIAIARPPQS
jgi:transcriptional regulator with XRE-family HTH domain